jgi:TPR repeat protein
MKTLLNTTLLFLLVIGFSGVVSGQDVSDFEETKRLAEQGEAYAQYNLGVMYANGEGVPENDAEAVRWYRLAAEQGHAIGQYNLGLMYAEGEGVPQNNVRAYVWWSVAAAQGDEGARAEFSPSRV